MTALIVYLVVHARQELRLLFAKSNTAAGRDYAGGAFREFEGRLVPSLFQNRTAALAMVARTLEQCRHVSAVRLDDARARLIRQVKLETRLAELELDTGDTPTIINLRHEVC